PQCVLVDAPGQVAFTELDLVPELSDLGSRPLAAELLVLGDRFLELLAVGADDVEDDSVVHRAGEPLGRPPLGDLRLQHADHVGRPLILLADGAGQRFGELLLQAHDDLSYRGDRTVSDLSAAGPQLLLERLHVEVDDGRDVERQELREDERGDHGQPERPPGVAAGAHAERDGQRPEQGGHRRHHDRAEAQQAALVDGLGRRHAGARTSRTTCWICDTAWLSETPCLRLNEIVTDGSWPRWLTVSGPSPGVRRATASSGTSLLCDERTYSRGNWVGSRW